MQVPSFCFFLKSWSQGVVAKKVIRTLIPSLNSSKYAQNAARVQLHTIRPPLRVRRREEEEVRATRAASADASSARDPQASADASGARPTHSSSADAASSAFRGEPSRSESHLRSRQGRHPHMEEARNAGATWQERCSDSSQVLPQATAATEEGSFFPASPAHAGGGSTFATHYRSLLLRSLCAWIFV